VLAEWRRDVRSSAFALLALTLTLGVIAVVAVRQTAARARAERDLANLQRLEADRLRDTNEQLGQALEREQKARRESEAASYLKDEFLMTVSHELRTPLTAIHGWTRMLATNAVPDGERRRALAAIERNARAQTRLIDDLLDVSRAISGKLRIDARPINLAEVVLASVETLKPAMEARRIRFSSSIEPDLAPIVADPDRVQQIVWNLLSNAAKFTPDDGAVHLRVARAGSVVEIAVTDTGSGIAPEFLPFVFDRFRQGEGGTRRRFGGLGLGLAIARHLTELHGGTIAVDSAGEGRGATFTVALPLRAARGDGRLLAPVAPAPEPPAPAARLEGLRVLVVDDDPDARDLFTSILAGAGAQVRTAASVPDALTQLGGCEIDVLLSDIEMPVHDGYELLRRAREARDGTGLLAVAVTAHARAVDRRRALDAGFDAHLAKPIEPALLVSEVAALASGGVRSAT
jgi:signal transduction histidine kinase